MMMMNYLVVIRHIILFIDKKIKIVVGPVEMSVILTAKFDYGHM